MIKITNKNNVRYLNGEKITLYCMYDGAYFSGAQWCNEAGEVVLDERTEYEPPSDEEKERISREIADLMHDDCEVI